MVIPLQNLKENMPLLLKDYAIAIFKDKNLDINLLIVKLASHDDTNITIFSTDEALKRIHSVDQY